VKYAIEKNALYLLDDDGKQTQGGHYSDQHELGSVGYELSRSTAADSGCAKHA
jgi:hypothetical protein